MNAEYQRLEAEASEVQNQINQLVSSCSQLAAADFPMFEAKIRGLHQRLIGLQEGMGAAETGRVCENAGTGGESGKISAEDVSFSGSTPQNGATDRRSHGDVAHHLLSSLAEPGTGKKQESKSRDVSHADPAGYCQWLHGGSAALLGSYEEAVQMLDDEGIRICVNTLRKVTAGMGEMLARLTKSGSVKVSEDATGRHIVVTTDGGRVRLREKRRGRTKKGHKRFKPAWREPRLFMIYATDDQGKIDPTFSPIIDGSLGSCDQLFRLLLSYLKALNVKDASKVLSIADGAKWIWRRVPALIKSLELTSDQTQQRIDFWHAVEYLGKIVESSSLKGKAKPQWRKTQKNRLYRGDIGLVVIAIEQLIGDKPSEDQATWKNYFVNHGLTHRRMDYPLSVNGHLPIGSGAIESAVRRVINLRVKSNATYWLRENA